MSIGNTPLIIAGVLLNVAALIILLLMSLRNKAAHERTERALTGLRFSGADVVREVTPQLPRAAAPESGPALRPETITLGGEHHRLAPPPERSHTIISVGSVIVSTGPHAGDRFPLSLGETCVGRRKAPGIAVALPRDGEVSARHGCIVVGSDGKLLYRDSSTNGSIVDGVIVQHGECAIYPGSIIEIGATTLQVTLRKSTAPASEPVDSAWLAALSDSVPPAVSPVNAAKPGTGVALLDSLSLPDGARTADAAASEPQRRRAAPTLATFGAELEIIQGTDKGRQYPIVQPETTIGREDVDIVLRDDTISRRHCTLFVDDDQFLISDKDSTHGTRVNGQRIGETPHPLNSGDELTLGAGRTVLRFHHVEP